MDLLLFHIMDNSRDCSIIEVTNYIIFRVMTWKTMNL